MLRKILDLAYSRRYLIVTNTVTGVVSMSLGDALQQNFEHLWTKPQQKNSVKQNDTFQWDSTRTRNMAVAGVYFSMFGHCWYSFLDRKFPSRIPGSVIKKVLAEAAMGPPLVCSCFFVIGAVKGHSWAQCWEYLKANALLIVSVEWAVYIPLQWLNFAYVPAKYRYLYVAAISLAYDAFLSYVLHRSERKKQQ